MKKRKYETSPNAIAGTITDAQKRYGLGKNNIMKIAEAAGARIQIGRSVRYHFGRMDAYMEACAGAAVEGGADSE